MRRSRCWNVILGIVVGAVTVAALLKLLVKPQPKPVHDPDRPNILCKLPVGNPEVQFSLPRPRVSYGTGPGATVRGWPPKGGFLIMTAGPADLEFLGYDRFQIVWQPDPEDPNTAADEEAHCYKMRQLGATWWESESAEFYASREVGSSTEEEKFIITGWPAGGGVWVLNGTVAEAGRKQAGMAFNAFNMEERSKIIEKLGGAFYANPKDCPDLDLAEPEDPVVQSRDEEL